MSIHFFHKKEDEWTVPKAKERFTIAYESFSLTRELLSLLLTTDAKLTVTMGRANCHYKDQFNKKVGRELAQSRMKTYDFKLALIQPMKDAILARFEPIMVLDEAGAIVYQGKATVSGFYVKIYRDSGKSRITFDIGY